MQINTVIDYNGQQKKEKYGFMVFFYFLYKQINEIGGKNIRNHNSRLSRLFGLWWLSYQKLSYHQFMCSSWKENMMVYVCTSWLWNNEKDKFWVALESATLLSSTSKN